MTSSTTTSKKKKKLYAKKIRFPEKDYGEDADYSDNLLKSGLLKNEIILDEIMYHYYYDEENTKTQKK